MNESPRSHAVRRVARLALALILAMTGHTLVPRPTYSAAPGGLQILATVSGQPDDVTVDSKGRLIWGDLSAGTVNRLDRGHIVVLARGLSVPEGVVALRDGSLIVAEQGLDRITRIGPRGGRSVLRRLQPVPGQEGVDGVGWDAHMGDLLVPDSPNGTVLRMTSSGRRVATIARGLGRPVDAAVDAHGYVLVPDEHLGTLVVISPRGGISRRGALSIPDDVAVDRSNRVWVTTLGDGGLWELSPGAAPRQVLSGLANPQGLTLDRCGDPIVVDQNSAKIVRLLLTPASVHCAL